MEVGFLGLGIMGKAMAVNLLRHGYSVTVWNRTLSKCEELVAKGASIGKTPALVVNKCKYTFAMLSDPIAALSVVFDKDGVLEQISTGKGYIDMSTVDADTSSKISEIRNATEILALVLRMEYLDDHSKELIVEAILANLDSVIAMKVRKACMRAVMGACVQAVIELTKRGTSSDLQIGGGVRASDGVIDEGEAGGANPREARPPRVMPTCARKARPPHPVCLRCRLVQCHLRDSQSSRAVLYDEAITEKGGCFLEAPVSGSKKPAEDGQLIILAAGEKALYDEVVPAFDVLGKRSFFLGDVGNGAKMKLVVNMIMGSMMNALSEGLSLANSSGLSQQTLLDVLELGAIANPMFKLKGPAMIQSSYPPAFPLKHQQKDMRLALALGDENAVSMPVAAAANEVFKKAISMGLGDQDFSAVHEAVKTAQDPDNA
ncbi:hypothetical protein ZIOFF_024437 [Zingiber officinale]|uniref:Glyoxylate/succinic semialdehyde reductase 1 n=1 Tax=Zingiber officinale TaxID=94328 RepID=A0A8J5LG66_ZINOF|nr:hypothetical protein ZIOFF_024437 [Zingiber officinale]